MRPLLKVVLPVALLLGSMAAFAQNSAPAVPKFDLNKQVEIKGVVTEINNYSCPITGTVGTHLMVKAGEEPIEVHVASAKFLQEYGITFKPGDNIQALGTRGEFNGKPAFLPRLIIVGSSTYYFRNPKGAPLW
jgi:DNA/RNA endonuclease YhcR with UshA esterase domain